MPYRDHSKTLAYHRDWKRKRRQEFLTDKSCVRCGSISELEIDHIDPTTKVSHRIWSWNTERRLEALAKCQVLCKTCHFQKSLAAMPISMHGTPNRYDKHKCRCGECKRAKSEKNALRKIRGYR